MIKDEKIIVGQCREKDRKAWNTVYNEYAGSLLATIMRYIPDRDCAHDILHDSFIKIFSSIGTFEWKGQGSLKAWMTRIAINMSLEHIRKHDIISESTDIETIREDDIIDDDEEIDGIPGEKLMEFIRQLPAGYRAVFNLYAIEEKSHKEIAEELGISEQTSASQYHRAKARLARQIKEYLKDKKQ